MLFISIYFHKSSKVKQFISVRHNFYQKKRENDKNDYILSFFLCFLSNFALQNQAITIMAVLLSCCTAWFEHINIGEEQVTIIIK